LTTLDDCRVKAARAEKHLNEITAELQAWSQRNPYEFVFKDNPEDPDETVVAVRINEYPPAHLGAILGDLLNNARAVLDYITTRLDLEAGGPGDKIYFPIFTDRHEFGRHAARKLAHLDPGHLTLIESVQPFNGTRRPLSRHPGAVMGSLSRIDKHHAVTPTLAAPLDFKLHWVFDDQVRTQTVKASITGEIHNNAEIARVRWPPVWKARIGPRPRKVEMRTSISMQIMFGEWELPEATWAVLSWVRDDVLARFAPILKKLG
jgi:hypothetical protein